MNLIEFYKKILGLAKIDVDQNGLLVIKKGKTSRPVTRDGKPFVLPTLENIKSCVEIDPTTNKPVVTKYLFNPNDESNLTTENKSLILLRDFLEAQLVDTFAIVGEMLLNLLNGDNEEVPEIASPEVIRFVDMIREYQAPGIKKIIDKNTIEHWIKIWEVTVYGKPGHEGLIHLYLKRGGEINGERYNRLGVVSFPVYELIATAFENKEKRLYGIPMRKKDYFIYMKYYEYVFEATRQQLEDGTILGSKNQYSPGIIALLKVYDFVAKHINKIIDVLLEEEYVDKDELKDIRLKELPWTDEELENIVTNLYPEVRDIPSENDLALITPNEQTSSNQEYTNNNATTNTINNQSTTNTDTPTPEDNTPTVGIQLGVNNTEVNRPKINPTPTINTVGVQNTIPEIQQTMPYNNYAPYMQQPIVANMGQPYIPMPQVTPIQTTPQVNINVTQTPAPGYNSYGYRSNVPIGNLRLGDINSVF